MIKLLFPLPKKIVIALSGGVDSVAITDFLCRKHEVVCAFFHHGTETSDLAFEFVTEFCNQRDLPLYVGVLTENRPKELSKEEYWRNSRYNFLESISSPVVTAHNLDDCVETYIWSCLNGNPKVIPKKRNNVLRPFLTTRKREFETWCINHDVSWIEDTSNQDLKYTRNYIRHELMPHALKVNPGLTTLVKKIINKQECELNNG